MKNSFLILIVSVLLAACSSTSSNNNTRNSRQTPIAQIQVQPSQSQPTAAQPTVADTSTSTPIPVTATSTAVSSPTPAATADPSQPADLDVLSSQGYAMNDGFYIVGELLNNTAAPMGNIIITATYYYQRAGKPVVLGTQDGSTLLDVIPAYGKAPFAVVGTEADFTTVRLSHRRRPLHYSK